jgi:undecaprenyl-diphosphatase
MLTLAQGILLGALQGISELFPISSLGHSVIIPQLLGWKIDQQDPFFLYFLVATHFATALVLLGFFYKDWLRILRGLGRSLRDREIKKSDPDAKLAWLLIAATIPAGIIGLIFQDQIRTYFLSATSAAIFLIVNAFMLLAAEKLRKKAPISGVRDSDVRIAKLSWWQGIKVGILQILALFPGMSRTGSTMAGSLIVGLSGEDSVRFSFLLSTPIIGAAAILELPQLFLEGNARMIHIAIAGAVASGIFAYLSVKFLVHYFEKENRTLTPFAAYCLIAGIVFLVFLSA